jgi:hypothetical protein
MFRTAAILVALGLAASSPALAQGQQGWGWWGGPGWGGGQGYGMGPGNGMMPGYGMGPGVGMMGQGYGPGPGNGMMPGYGPGVGAGMGPGAGMMMGAIDADQSGDVTAEEAAAHAEAMFALMDVNVDGALAADEMGGGRMGMMSPWGRSEAMQERHAARFAAKDSDGNGQVSMAEFLAAEKAQYDAADSDGDGKVTPWELRAAMWQ